VSPKAENNATIGAMPPEIAAQLREIGPRIEAQKAAAPDAPVEAPLRRYKSQ
jgi:hypothetical protein